MKLYYDYEIAASTAAVWHAFTDPESTTKFFFNSKVRSSFMKGDPINFFGIDENGEEKLIISGKILDAQSPSRLSFTFCFKIYEEVPSVVSISIDSFQGNSRVKITHEGFKGDSKTYEDVHQGWPIILDSLKNILEKEAGNY